MLITVLDIFFTLYQGFLIIYTIKKQVAQKRHSIVYDIVGITSVALYCFLIQYLDLPLPDTLFLVVPFLYIKVTSDVRWLPCFLWTLLDGFLFFGTLTLISGLFDIQIATNGRILQASEKMLIIYSLCGNGAVTVVMNIASRISKLRNDISHVETLLFIVLLLLTFVMSECFFLARISKHNENILLLGATCTFVVMLLLMILYERLTESNRKQRVAELQAQTAQLTGEHQEELKTIYKNMLSEQHDLRHLITTMEEMLASDSMNDETRCHALELLGKPSSARVFITGNIAVDAILRAKWAVMENVGITFEFTEFPLTTLPISEQDFCILLSNLLDNAIEGVMRLPAVRAKRSIHLTFSKVWEMFFITCINDADEETIHKTGDEFLSSKTHAERHGFGTKSMRRMVEEAAGTIDMQVQNGEFTVQIMLGEKQ